MAEEQRKEMKKTKKEQKKEKKQTKKGEKEKKQTKKGEGNTQTISNTDVTKTTPTKGTKEGRQQTENRQTNEADPAQRKPRSSANRSPTGHGGLERPSNNASTGPGVQRPRSPSRSPRRNSTSLMPGPAQGDVQRVQEHMKQSRKRKYQYEP